MAGSGSMANASCSIQIPFSLLPKGDIPLVIHVAINVAFSAAATLGNLLVIWCFLRTSSLHSPTNFLLLGLAFSDVGVGMVVEPLYLTTLMTIYKGLPVNCSILVAYSIALTFLVAISLFTIAAISIDRYLAIYFPLRYQDIVTGRKVAYFLVTLWIACGLLTLTRMTGFGIYLICTLIVITICLSSTCFAYSRIFMVLRRHQAQIRDQTHPDERISNMAQLRKSVINTFYVVFAFVACFLPHCCLVIFLNSTSSWSKAVMLFHLHATSLIFFNSTLNPFIYWCRRGEFRDARGKCFKTHAVKLSWTASSSVMIYF